MNPLVCPNTYCTTLVGYPIYHVERLGTRVQRVAPADEDGSWRARLPSARGHLQARNSALERLDGIGGHPILELLVRERGGRPGEGGTRGFPIARDHRLLYGHVHRLHHHVDLGAVAHGDLLGSHAHVDEL